MACFEYIRTVKNGSKSTLKTKFNNLTKNLIGWNNYSTMQCNNTKNLCKKFINYTSKSWLIGEMST
jgi:hypothetical protein